VAAPGGVASAEFRAWCADMRSRADSSLCPTATGVNPMISTMALAAWVAKAVCADIARTQA
jgi:hypothetical protein